MKVVKKFFKHPDFWPLLTVLFFGVLASWPLFGRGYFNMHDDLQMMRLLEMEKCVKDGQFPCRWVPDMGYGFGFPLFNFYPPLPYLVGQGIRILGFDFVSSAKGIFVLAFIASGVAMYFFAKEFFSRLGGVLAAVFYIWAPYHAVDAYVRGAANESWALVFFPLISWCSYRLIKDKDKLFGWVVGLALSWFGLLTSHNLMVLIFTPVFASWCLIWVIKEKKWNRIPHLFLSGIWTTGLAAFFTMPALMENKFTHVSSVLSGYYDYSGHFASLNQILFSRFWGYGPSVWLENDGMSFQVGHLHWIGSIVITAWTIYRYIKTKRAGSMLLITCFMFVVGWAALFLVHPKSTPIWLTIKPLAYLQFPWRFLALPTFSFSLMIGAVSVVVTKGSMLSIRRILITGALALALVVLNWNYFKPEYGRLGYLTDEEKFSGAAWELQQTAGIWDYLPLTAKFAPREPMKRLVEVMRGEAEVSNEKQGTNWVTFSANVAEGGATIRMGIFQFPGWRVWVDGEEVKTYVADEEEWGRIYFEVPAGSRSVSLKFTNTPVRTISNYISLGAWVLLLTSPFWVKGIKIS